MIDDEEVLQAREKFMKAIQNFLQKFSRYSFGVMPKVLLIAWERFSEIKHAFIDKQYQPKEIQELMCKLLKDVRNINEELAEYINSLSWNHPTFYNNDLLMQSQPTYQLKNLKPCPILSEYEVTSDDESECDVPDKDESSPIFTTFSNPLFDCNDDFTSSDDESLSNEDVPMENFKVYSNPLFDDEEINSNKIDPHYFNAESDLIESLSNRDTLFDSYPMFDYLEEFSGELIPTSIINEERIKRKHKEYISLMEKLLTINSFPRPLENFHANTIIETLPTSPIPVDDSDFLREEIDIFTITDDLMPPGIESDNYDSKGDIHFLEELLGNDSIPLPKNESSNFDHHDDSSFPCPPPEPPDVEIFFEFDSRELIPAVMNNIDELNEDEYLDPGRGVKTPFLTLASPLRASGISSGWNFYNGAVLLVEIRVRDPKKHNDSEIYTSINEKEAQDVGKTDCHAGMCELTNDPTARFQDEEKDLE
uniref:Reverse transcriptase domain-containing protein n=1 Tax=Tanacetum cinerariifolium TaxID=118510 RepID=A0A6L2LRZ8_TANCI|nr:hypothetical protein [Tanacetum cinerariifolium]